MSRRIALQICALKLRRLLKTDVRCAPVASQDGVSKAGHLLAGSSFISEVRRNQFKFSQPNSALWSFKASTATPGHVSADV